MQEYLKGFLNELETESNNKNIRNFHKRNKLI